MKRIPVEVEHTLNRLQRDYLAMCKRYNVKVDVALTIDQFGNPRREVALVGEYET